MKASWKINISKNHIQTAKGRCFNIGRKTFPIYVLTLLSGFDLMRLYLLSDVSNGQTAGKALSMFLLKNQQ